MVDDVVLNKTAIMERCVSRAREEYYRQAATFADDLSRQDAAILNIQRACQAAMDLGHHVVRRFHLGHPEDSRQMFALLAQAGWIKLPLAQTMKNMVGFRCVVLHECVEMQLPIIISIITKHLDDLLAFGQTMRQESLLRSPP